MKNQIESTRRDVDGMRVFVESLRKSLAHDLRTPLGTIVNYAAMLESFHGPEHEEVRNFAGRIRHNAMRTAGMLQHLSTATILAARPPSIASLDARTIARELAHEHGATLEPEGEAAESTTVLTDPTLLAFVWRAFLAVERDAASGAAPRISIVATRSSDAQELELCVGGRDEARRPIELAQFLREAGDSARPEDKLALRLAADLIALHGGELELTGAPARGASLRLRLPPPV